MKYVQEEWFMSEQKKKKNLMLRIRLKNANPSEEIERVEAELVEFQSRNMYNLLRYMIYLVDYMRANNIVWGVGRGSKCS